ncbi:MAG: hypothetical protein NXH75_01940 [Halobacteriovoraceae bacterium]|nr:hypothetical protein [Halobacteriovoraceae bacterium]
MKFWPLVFLTLTLLSLFQAPPRSFAFDNSKEKIDCKNIKPILCAYYFGNKKGLPRKIIKAHREMNLLHLMTPSGLHLSSLLLLIAFFSKTSQRFFKKDIPVLQDKRYSLFLLALLTYPLDGIDSFKRMILFALLRLFPFLQISQKKAFFLTFLICAGAGQLENNPLSFSFSFLFLGILLFSQNKLFLFINLFLAQAFISEWMGNPFSPLTAIAGLILSSFSPLLFIGFLPELFFPNLPFSSWWLSFLKSIHLTLRFPFPFIFLTSIPLFYFTFKPKLLRLAIPLVILLTPQILTPNRSGASFPSPPPRGFLNKEITKNKMILTYENKMRCHVKILGDEWRSYCYK